MLDSVTSAFKPITLHSKSSLAKLPARHSHETYGHAEHSFVLAFLQRKYYLVQGSIKLVRSTIKQCVYCTRMKAETAKQIMGDLPAIRTQIARPFTNCGIDFAGPQMHQSLHSQVSEILCRILHLYENTRRSSRSSRRFIHGRVHIHPTNIHCPPWSSKFHMV